MSAVTMPIKCFIPSALSLSLSFELANVLIWYNRLILCISSQTVCNFTIVSTANKNLYWVNSAVSVWLNSNTKIEWKPRARSKTDDKLLNHSFAYIFKHLNIVQVYVFGNVSLTRSELLKTFNLSMLNTLFNWCDTTSLPISHGVDITVFSGWIELQWATLPMSLVQEIIHFHWI